MPDPEKRENTRGGSPCGNTRGHAPGAPAKDGCGTEEASSQYFFGEPLVGFDPSEITGKPGRY